jgi:hypothetical protein
VTSLADVRRNLATIAGDISGWSGSMYVGDAVSSNFIKVFRPAFDPRVVFGGGKRQLTFRCVAYAKRVDAASSEQSLDELAEPTGDASFLAAVQESTNWTVDIDYAVVTEVGEVAVAVWTDGVEYLVCPFDIEVVW